MIYKITNYRANGEIQEWEQAAEPSLKQLQELVGGYIEKVPTSFYIDLGWFGKKHPLGRLEAAYCDEDGKFKAGYGVNPHFPATPWGDALCGDVVVIDKLARAKVKA